MKRRAFTLVELLVVIAIIGLLSTVAVVSMGSARSRSRAAKIAGDLQAIKTALDMYIDYNGGYPCFDHNWVDTWETTWSASYLRWPRTPYNTRYHFEDGAVWPPDPFTYSISMENIPAAEAQIIDNLIDDGSLTTGLLRRSEGTDPVRIEWGGVDQTLPMPIPETCP